MKIALVTANIGGIDKTDAVPAQSLANDRYVFSEIKLLPRITDNRLKARYLKHCLHRYLPDYDAYVWIDGKFRITSENFVSRYVGGLENSDMVITKHPDRATVFEEFNFFFKQFQLGGQYLCSRYSPQETRTLKTFFQKDLPLYECGVFARRNCEKMNRVFEEIWMRILEYCNYEQLWYSFFEERENLKYDVVDYRNEYFKWCGHLSQGRT